MNTVSNLPAQDRGQLSVRRLKNDLCRSDQAWLTNLYSAAFKYVMVPAAVLCMGHGRAERPSRSQLVLLGFVQFPLPILYHDWHVAIRSEAIMVVRGIIKDPVSAPQSF